ncbi:hypothetical protein AVEN_206800-1 [Araneus ventricosus]|uniref:DUF4817 domain-containing protein n=1 Tax=Araneus ventricosus TaxID=182803 RepID=A0A4Y2C5E6_ARAVE|nr:hypothetical protein AVEN_206800-1 [Araneus ventricosus]
MSKYRVFERISIVKAYYSSNNSPITAQRKFATEYKLKTTGPSVITIKNVIEEFERTGSVDQRRTGEVASLPDGKWAPRKLWQRKKNSFSVVSFSKANK